MLFPSQLQVFLGSPLKLWASVGHWWIWHFDLAKYTEKQKPRVLVSLAAVAAFALIGLPAIASVAGIGGVLKYWLMPWLGYHFWMSTFTVVHHTAPHIPFKPADEWNAAKAQLSGGCQSFLYASLQCLCGLDAWFFFLAWTPAANARHTQAECACTMHRQHLHNSWTLQPLADPLPLLLLSP
jgi:hypothetical protein